MAERIPQATAIRVPLQAVLSSDHATPATGKTIAITISKAGAAYANPSVGALNASEISNGSYYVDLSVTDTATLGPLNVRGTSGTIDQIVVQYDVVVATQVPAPAISTPQGAVGVTPSSIPFLTPVDIANRALQHVGAIKLDPALGFTENSKNADETSFAYTKLRRAELQRNLWGFATKKVILRPIDYNTLLLTPSLWSSVATYFFGSIVADQNGYLWSSKIPSNLGNDPLLTLAWEPYFGPLSVSLYDSTKAYYTGEVVYTAAGDGTYNTYASLADRNAIHPALPNQWNTLAGYFKNNVVQQFPAWSSGTTYSQGQGVLYTDNNVYASIVNGNIGNAPSTNPTRWALIPTLNLSTLRPGIVPTPLPGSTPIAEWSQNNTYALGNGVIFNTAVYVAIAAGTGNFPNAAASTFWKPVTGGAVYMSLIDANLGNNPANAPALWASGTTYGAAALVGGSDGIIYSSIAGGNLGHDPTINPTFWTNTGVLNPWTTVFTQGAGNPLWTQIGGAAFPFGVALNALDFTYSIASSPTVNSPTSYIFRQPAGFLRRAPQDPRAGSTSWLGAPSGLQYPDWKFENRFIVSSDPSIIMLRFVADVTDVRQMHDMFCEGLAARIAIEVCEPLTQSAAKRTAITAEYSRIMNEARTVDAIEVGAIEPPEDDYITCRQ